MSTNLFAFKSKNRTGEETYNASNCCGFAHSSFSSLEYVTFPRLNNNEEKYILNVMIRYNLPFHLEEKRISLPYSEYPSRGLLYVGFSLLRMLHSAEQQGIFFKIFKKYYEEYDSLWIASIYVSMLAEDNGHRWWIIDAQSRDPLTFLSKIQDLYQKDTAIMSSIVPATSIKNPKTANIETIIEAHQGVRQQEILLLDLNNKEFVVGDMVTIDIKTFNKIYTKYSSASLDSKKEYKITNLLKVKKAFDGKPTDINYAELNNTHRLPVAFLNK